MHRTILIIGSGDLGTACALRLFRSAFTVTMLGPAIPADLYYFRNYSNVPVSGSKIIDDIRAYSFADFIYNRQNSEQLTLDSFVEFSGADRCIAVITTDDIKKMTQRFDYAVICDAMLMDITALGQLARCYISCHARFENFAQYSVTSAGPLTGKVRYPFLSLPLSPAADNDKNLLLADREGVFVAGKSAGQSVSRGERIGMLDDEDVLADREGYIAGVLRSGVIVSPGQPLAHIDSNEQVAVRELPLQSLAVAGGVLEAVLYDMDLNAQDG